ncbi:MAG: Double zinc ribbon [Thermoleophilia bacterium]|nr:Double zinc ribbon [Thermoleophilia bacterium]
MVTFDDAAAGPVGPSRECPGCGAPDLAGDDFCHECGHAFAHFGGDLDSAFDAGGGRGGNCPTCGTGELVRLDHGRTQCDQCGYMARDEG